MKNDNLIYHVAWKFHATTGIDIEELKAEASLAYAEALNDYKDNKGALFTTFAYVYMKNQLSRFIYLEKRNQEMLHFEDGTIMNMALNESSEKLDEILGSISDKAAEICRYVIQKHPAFFNDQSPKMARGELVRELRLQGWSWGNIWRSFSEIKAVL